MVGNF